MVAERMNPRLHDRLPMGADLYCDLVPPPDRSWRDTWRDMGRGLSLVAAATLAAAFLADRYGAPLTLMALLVGLSLNFLGSDARLRPGLACASKSLLRWGIVLLGLRVTAAQIVALGPLSLAMIAAILGLTILAGIAAARLLRLSPAFGVLAGGAVAICGASAALALAATLGERRIGPAALAQVLVGIAAMSAAAMLLYPMLAHVAGLGDAQAGFLFGAAIHDVAQALGAGYGFSQPAGETAAIVKLARVALLAPVLAIVAARFPDPAAEGRPSLAPPLFVVGFFACAGLNSLGIVSSAVTTAANGAAAYALAAAVAATGISAPLAALRQSGARPIAVLAIATIAALLLAFAGAMTMIDPSL